MSYQTVGVSGFTSNNKIPEYAREYKREYQFIRGINKEFIENEEYYYYYYYFSPESYTDENRCMLPSKSSGSYSDFKSFIKSSKIPEYVKEYKREYLFLIG